MSTPTPSRQPPHVQHNFEGDVAVLNQSFDRRHEIRKTLTALQQDLMKTENRPTQIKAEIKLRIGGDEAKEHSYTITVTSSDFNPEDFARQVSTMSGEPSDERPGANHRPTSSPAVSRAVNGQQATPAQSTSRAEFGKPEGDDNVLEIRPFKRPRTDRDASTPNTMRHGESVSGLKNNLADLKHHSSNSVDELYSFMKEWHSEWVRQGGWLFDNITKASTASNNTKAALDKKLDTVQDIIGQSMNSASASTMTELTNISKLIPWLEQCRKSSADKVQAREEKWRTSSATFHDQTRREREAAETRIERKLEEQRVVLLKVARANGIDLDETEAAEAGSPGASDKSLGAQLTAELNMVAERANTSRSDAEHETINIDDD